MTQPRRTLTKAASLNAFASALEYGARLVVGFVVNPFLVNGLGDFLYGVWQILGRIAGYLSVAGGRANQALKNSLANKQASDDYEEKRRLVANSLIVWALFIPVLGLLGALVVWQIPFWVEAPDELTFDVRFAAAIVIGNLILLNLSQVPRSVLEGENLLYKRMGLSAGMVVVGGGLTVLAVELGAGIPGVAFALAGRTILAGAIFVPIVRANVPWFGLARVSFRAVMSFLRLSSLFMVWRFVMQLMVASDVIVLGILISPETVADYALTKYAPETLVGLVALVVFGVTPGLGGIIGSGDMAKAARVRTEIMAGTWLVATAVGGTVLMWNQAFVGAWVGSEHYAGLASTLLILLVSMQLTLIRNDANIIDLTLQLGKKVTLGLVSAVLSVALAVLFVKVVDNGIVGLLIGFLAGRSILTFAYPLLVGQALGVSLGVQAKGILRPVTVTAIVFGAAWLIGDNLTSATWLNLVLGTATTVGAVAALAFTLGLSARQRKGLLSRARQALPGGGS